MNRNQVKLTQIRETHCMKTSLWIFTDYGTSTLPCIGIKGLFFLLWGLPIYIHNITLTSRETDWDNCFLECKCVVLSINQKYVYVRSLKKHLTVGSLTHSLCNDYDAIFRSDSRLRVKFHFDGRLLVSSYFRNFYHFGESKCFKITQKWSKIINVFFLVLKLEKNVKI